MDYKKGELLSPPEHMKHIGNYLLNLDLDKKYLVRVIEGTKAKTLAQNDSINGLIREMYRISGDSKPDELEPFLETYDLFREWVKSKIICLFDVKQFVHPKTDEIIKRNTIRSIGDYNLTDGKTAIKMLIAYITRSGMIDDTKIQEIINNMEYRR